MAAPAHFDIRREVAELVDSMHALHRQAERERDALIQEIAETLRRTDWLLERIAELPPGTRLKPSDALTTLHAKRQEAFDRMEGVNPDEAFLWTPEMQASLRASDAYFASGQSRVFPNDQEFDAFLQEQCADV
jgi:hypothetical protein